MTSFKLGVQSRGAGSFVVAVFGSLDSEHYLEFEEKVMPMVEPATRVILLDLKEMSFISSMGIGSLIKLKKALKEHQGKLILANPQPQVRKVFDIIKAMPSEIIFKSVAEADNYLSKIQQSEIEKGKQ